MPFLPRNAARACIQRSHRFLRLTSSEHLATPLEKSDLRRMALVMAVAALDSYLHRLVIQRMSHVRSAGSLPGPLKKFAIPFSDLAEFADLNVTNQRHDRPMRPWVKAKNAFQDQLNRQTFQSSDQVAEALSMAGVEKAWKKISKKLGSSPNTVRARLNRIVQHRNQIVHEGDFVRAIRPRKLKYNPIRHRDIKADVKWVEELLEAIEDIVAEA